MKFIDETRKLFNLKITKLIIKVFIKIVQNKNKIVDKIAKQKKTRLFEKRKKFQNLITNNLKKKNVRKLQTILAKKY